MLNVRNHEAALPRLLRLEPNAGPSVNGRIALARGCHVGVVNAEVDLTILDLCKAGSDGILPV